MNEADATAVGFFFGFLLGAILFVLIPYVEHELRERRRRGA